MNNMPKSIHPEFSISPGYSVLNNGRPTFAFFSGMISSYEVYYTFCGATQASKDKNVNILGFSGGDLDLNVPLSYTRSKLFRLLDPKLFDGVILQDDNLLRKAADKHIKDFFNRLSSLPIISIGSNFENITTIFSDQKSGTENILEHLISFHGYRNIAFFRGPELKYAPSQENMNTYIDTLEKHGIPINHDMIVYNETAERLTEIKLDALLDKYKGRLDAIIAIKARQARDIIDALERKGFRVPQDIAVVSCIGEANDSFTEPSLTQMHTPFFEMGYQAVLALIDKSENKPFIPKIIVPSEFILGESCGCNLKNIMSENLEAKIAISASHIVSPCDQDRIVEDIMLDIKRSMNTYEFAKLNNKINIFVSEFADALVNQKSKYFLDLLMGLFDVSLKSKLTLWLKVVTIFHQYLLKYNMEQSNNDYISELTKSMLLFIYYAKHKETTFKLHLAQFNILQIEEISTILNTEFDLEQLEVSFHKLNISDCYISILDEINNMSLNSYSKLLMAIRNNNYVNINGQDVRFPSNHLLPDILEPYTHSYALIILPLYFFNVLFGTIIFNFDSENHILYENIQTNISIALSNQLQFKELQETKERFSDIAKYDSLTGLPNRFSFNEELGKIIHKNNQESHRFALMYIDLDRFKYVNDVFGHQVGDDLLCKIAEIIKSCLCPDDFVARLGGDEFTIILPRIDRKNDASVVAKKILRRLHSAITVDGNLIYCSASIGIVIYPIDGSDSLSLLKNADIAMYSSKEQGRNRFSFYNIEMELRSLERNKYENILRQALKNNEFSLVYQPQYDYITDKISGLEALLSIDTPDQGLVMPSSFITLAEELGLLEQIGEWVLKTACLQSKLWKEKGFSNLRIAVNLSAWQFNNRSLADIFLIIMKKYDVDPKMIEFEITESAMMQNEEETLRILDELKELGCTIALDDFGTGFSSLSYLKKFPIDVVKIDKSFITDCTTNSYSSAIIKAIIAMAESLNIKVVAEGVETLEQLNYIRSLGCHIAQGYLFSKPLKPEYIDNILE